MKYFLWFETLGEMREVRLSGKDRGLVYFEMGKAYSPFNMHMQLNLRNPRDERVRNRSDLSFPLLDRRIGDWAGHGVEEVDEGFVQG